MALSPAFLSAAANARGQSLTNILTTWQNRAQQAQSIGVPKSAVLPVAQYDIKRRLQGYRPLTSLEAALSMKVQATGQSVLKVPEEHRDSGPLGIITNIPEDVKDITVGLLPHHILPALAKEAYQTVAHPIDTFEGLGAVVAGITTGGPFTSTGQRYLQQAAQTPGVRFIPGVTTLSDPSRIFTHPVQSFLDVYPIGVGASKLAARAFIPGETLSKVLETGQAAREFRKVSPLEVPPELTLTGREAVYESLGRGRPAQALYRSTFNDSFRQGVNSRIAAAQESLNVAPFQRNMQHGADIMLRDINAKQREAFQRNIEPLTELQPAERHTLYEMATRPDKWTPERMQSEVPNLIPHLENVRRVVDEELTPLVEQSGDLFSVEVRPGYKVYYSKKGRGAQVYSAQQQFERAQEKVAAAEERFNQVSGATPEAEAFHLQRIEKLRNQLAEAQARLERKAESIPVYQSIDELPGKSLPGNKVIPQTPELLEFGRKYGLDTNKFLDSILDDLRTHPEPVRQEFVKLMEDQGYSKITRYEQTGTSVKPARYESVEVPIERAVTKPEVVAETSPLDYHGIEAQRLSIHDPEMGPSNNPYHADDTAAFVDYSITGEIDGRPQIYIHYASSAAEGKGYVRQLIEDLYKKYPDGDFNWGMISSDAMAKLYYEMEARYPDAFHKYKIDFNRDRIEELKDLGAKRAKNRERELRREAAKPTTRRVRQKVQEAEITPAEREYSRSTLAEDLLPKKETKFRPLTEKQRIRTEARVEALRQQIDELEYQHRYQAYDGANTPAGKRAQANLERRIKKLEDATDRYNETLRTHAPDSFLEMLRPELRQRVIEKGGQRAMEEGSLSPAGPFGDFDAATALDIFESTGDPSKLIPQHEWNAIKRDVEATWQTLLDEGYHPIWVHNLPSSKLGPEFNPRPLGPGNPNPSILKSRSMDLTPRMTDIAASLHAAQVQLIKKAAHEAYIDRFIETWGRSLDEEVTPGTGVTLHDEISKATDQEIARLEAKGQWHPTNNRQNIYDEILNRHYEEYDPSRLFEFGKARAAKYEAAGKKLYVPRTLADTAKKLLGPQEFIKGPVGRALSGSTRAFKVAVLGLSPKHLMDVLFSDTIMMMMRGGKEELANLLKAYRMAKNGGKDMPIELPRHIDLDDPATLFEIGRGKHWGRVVTENASVLYKFEEFMNNWQRSMSYLGERDRALAAGKTAAEAELAGIEHARKALLDIEGMSPFERAVLRQVFPFYGFVRYVFRYALTYPIDHPVRAAIISTASRIAKEDADSSLPWNYYNYFFFGKPSPSGDVTGIDLRQTNPFRDFADLLTFTGFMRSLHPLASGAFQIAGMDPMSAAPELYPDLSYDPSTGRVQFNRMSEGQAAFTLAKSVLPQLELGDWLLKRSDNMKQLAASNPEAYNRALQRSLFLPLIPRKFNLGEIKRSAEMAKLESGSRAVTKAFRDSSHVSTNYNYLPLNGQLYTPQQINTIIDAAKSAGMNPREFVKQVG